MTRREADGGIPEPAGSGFLITKFGTKVLRKLTPEELGLKTTEVVTTQEGFKIHGVNETSLIRSLKSLNGTPIQELESRMQSGGISGSGFLGSDESLTQVLAEDNDTVLRMGLTHQQLAEFLFYFDDADKYLKDFTSFQRVFEYNGRTFVHSSEAYRGIQNSPFYDGTGTNKDHKIVCLEDGSAINYSGLLPFMIHRYGFYEGRGVGYRLDPERLSEVVGFTPRAKGDPVATLVKNINAAVEIKTGEQLWRMSNLTKAGMEIMQTSNYRIIPENIGALLTFLGLLSSGYYERYGAPTDARVAYRHRQSIVARLDTGRLTAQPYRLGGHNYSILAEIVPLDFPQLKQSVLGAIQNIELATGGYDKFASEQFLKNCLRAIANKRKDGGENPRQAYFAGLLQRVNKDPDTVLQIYDAAAKLMEEVPNLTEALEATLPSLREQVIALYKQLGMQVSDNATLEQLLLSKESMENYKKEVNASVEFAKRVGGLKIVNESDIGMLLRVLVSGASAGRQYTDDELAAMKRLGIEPDLIPYAFKAVGAARSSAAMVIAQLYNGAARRARDLEQALTGLPANMDEKAKNAAETLIKKAMSPYSTDKVDIQKLMSRLNARAAELQKKGAIEEADQAALTEADVLNEYVGLLLPPFKDLLTSPFIRKSLKEDAVEVVVDPKALEAFPGVEVKEDYYSRKVRKVVVGGQEYVISEYYIRCGDYELRLLSGNRVPVF